MTSFSAPDRPATGEGCGDTAVGLLTSRYITRQVVVVAGGQSVVG